MSVDLVALDRIACRLFFPETISHKNNLVQFLQKKTIDLKQHLGKEKTKLVSIQYNEIRNGAVRFEGRAILFIRKEFARNQKNDLFQITSVFAGEKKLQEIEIHNLKTDLIERLIF